MTAAVYYNESDPFCVAWLRALIDAGELPDGEVDPRSITDVRADDVRPFVACHFFAGIGGWPYAFRIADWPADRPVWSGSCPCQPFSAIGEGTGADDSRDLWPAWFHIIRQCRPASIFGEQVASADGLGWVDRVFADLESQDYTVAAFDLCAAGVGAPINRPRLFTVAQSSGARLEGHGGDGDDGDESGRVDADAPGPIAASGVAGEDAAGVDALSLLRRLDLHDSRRTRRGLSVSANRPLEDGSVWSRIEQVPCADGWRVAEPGTFPLAHGIPARVGRLRAYGNAIVPQVAAEVIRAYLNT